MFTIKIKYQDKEYAYPKDITMLEISNNFKDNYEYPIIIGSINNKLVELNTKIDKDCTIDFYDISNIAGNKAYERGLVYLYIRAVKEVLNCDVIIEHSIDKGIYTRILNNKEINEDSLKEIANKMNELVETKIPFEKQSISRIDAINYFEFNGQNDKALLLKYISNTYVNLYKFGNMYDYFFGEMPLDTSYVSEFKLTLVKPNGIILRYPNLFCECKIVDYTNHEKLFSEFKKYHEWCRTVGISNVSDLNDVISSSKINNLIYLSEIEQNNRLFDIAKSINNNKDIRIVLMAGPSSSGKTTTSKKLGLFLRSMGLSPKAISIDDYFLDREKTPRKANGEYDFESLEAINVELFNKQLKELLNGEEVILPEYNFITGKGEFKKKRLKLLKNDILIVEGLHALNEMLTSTIERKNKYKIYLSPLTSLNIDNHNRINTTDNRLLRRLVRDNMTRGYNAADTLKTWPIVRSGEEKYVFPHQDDADVVFNTSLIYELGVLRLYGEPLLFSVAEDDPNYKEAIRLINLLRNILPITSDGIPLDSIIREFIGDSYFKE